MSSPHSPRKASVDANQARLLRERIGHLPAVAKYLRSRNVFNENVMREFSERNESDQRSYLIDHVLRRGEHAFNALLEALVATGQIELAKSLNPDLNLDEMRAAMNPMNPLASGDGNCVSAAGQDEKRERPSASGSSEQLMLEPPSVESIQQNERIYSLEKKLYADVPATDGLFPHLTIVKCAELPANFDLNECYANMSNPKGLAVIFNNRRFNKMKSPGLQLGERHGSDVDCKNMERLLIELGYHVKIKLDLTAKEMLEAMARFSLKSEHQTCHSAIVVVLTHGTHGQLYGADGELISVEQFVSFLNGSHCPTLKNKPKLFIIQACRGDRFDDGVDGLISGGSGDTNGMDGGISKNPSRQLGNEQLSLAAALRKLVDMDEADARSIAKTPTDADILIAYATTPGYVSWRNTMRGSWFIQAICEIFPRHAHREEILHLFTAVNRRVAEQLSSSDHKQVPEPSSRLTKKFYFLPGL